MELLKKIKPDEIKWMAILFFVALFLLVILLKYLFLIPRALVSMSDENDLRSQIKNYVTKAAITDKINRNELEKELDLLNKRFPKKEEIPIILDELEQSAKKAGVEIVSITEQGELRAPVEVNVGKEYKFRYQALSLTLDLTCHYINLAKLLEALDNWPRGVVIVKGFSIQKDESITERLKVNNLVIEIPIIGDDNK